MPKKQGTLPIVRRLNLDTARNNVKFNYPGKFIKLKRASSAAATITVRFNSEDGDGTQLFRGEGFDHFPFDRLYITHTAQAGEWVELVIQGEPDEAAPGRFEAFYAPAAQDVEVTNDSPLDVNIAGQDASVNVDANITAQADELKTEQLQQADAFSTSGIVAFSQHDTAGSSGTPQVAIAAMSGVTTRIHGSFLSVMDGTKTITMEIRNAAGNAVARTVCQTSNGINPFENLELPEDYTVVIYHTSSASGTYAAIWASRVPA